MPARDRSPLPDSIIQREIRIHSDTSDSQQNSEDISYIDAPTRTLSPISSTAMNTLYSTSTPTYEIKPANGIIRTVPSEAIHLDPPTESRRSNTKSDPMPYSSIKQSATVPSISTHSQPPLIQQNSIPRTNGIVRTISAEFGPSRTFTTSPSPSDDSGALSPAALSPPALSPSIGGAQWSSAVGRANLGKSGRVIERLMGENDMLKREIKLEGLRAEDSRQTVKMAEAKMEALVGEYEGRLHDAAVNKTLLKRRERQLADLKGQVEGEKERADRAVESERGWREAMERLEEDRKRKVEEAQLYAALMEGRCKAMTSHWKEQGAEVSRTVGKLGKEIENLVEERQADDRRMNMLQGICEQQKEELSKLRAQKEGIGEAFEKYKTEQENLLRDIKQRALEQEKKNEKVLEESTKVLGELKWALGVKRNVKGAQ